MRPSSDHPVPLVELEVRIDHMRQQMRAMVLDHFGETRRLIEAAIGEQLRPERVADEVNKHVREVVDITIREAVQNQIRWAVEGELRDAVRAAATAAAAEAIAGLKAAARR